MPDRVPDFSEVAAFHGHTCPGLAMGYRVALAALEWLRTDRAPDEEIVAIAENRSCAVDALQYVLGTTLGKGNLLIEDWGKHGYTIYLRASGDGRRFFFSLPESLRQLDRPELVRAILEAPTEDLLAVGPPAEPLSPRAQILPSVPCAECGEATMESALTAFEGRRVCRPCLRQLRAEPLDDGDGNG